MPVLELFPKSARGTDQSSDQPSDQNTSVTAQPPRPGDSKPAVATATDPAEIAAPIRHAHHHRRTGLIKLQTHGYGELEEHELIHLIDSLDDERSRARFRKSIYISAIIWLAVGWFLFYGPRVLFHIPQYRDPIAALKEHDQQLVLNLPKTQPVPKIAPKIDNKTMAALKRQAELERLARQTPPTPQPPTQQAPPAPQEEAHNTAPPVPQPTMPLPSAPAPTSPLPELPSAPRPNLAQNSQSPGEAAQNTVGGARGGGGVPYSPGSAGPSQAGATIISDIGDWDPSAYMRRLHNDIQRNWSPLIPEEAQPPLLKRGTVGIRFTILRDGSISGPNQGQPVLETTSGEVALDKAAWYAITTEGQFPPLPKEYKRQQLDLRIGFLYNEPIQ